VISCKTTDRYESIPVGSEDPKLSLAVSLSSSTEGWEKQKNEINEKAAAI
jgi:hypothetical protein